MLSARQLRAVEQYGRLLENISQLKRHCSPWHGRAISHRTQMRVTMVVTPRCSQVPHARVQYQTQQPGTKKRANYTRCLIPLVWFQTNHYEKFTPVSNMLACGNSSDDEPRQGNMVGPQITPPVARLVRWTTPSFCGEPTNVCITRGMPYRPACSMLLGRAITVPLSERGHQPMPW